MRLPYLGESQVIRIWFNSPVGKTQRCLKTKHAGFVDQQIDWVGNFKAEEEELDALGRVELDQISPQIIYDEDDMTEDELQRVADQIHDQSVYIKLMEYGLYHPQYDYPTYFRLDLPVSALLTADDNSK